MYSLYEEQVQQLIDKEDQEKSRTKKHEIKKIVMSEDDSVKVPGINLDRVHHKHNLMMGKAKKTLDTTLDYHETLVLKKFK
jgi:hypothetical protein